MSEQDVDKSRRRFLTAATTVVGAIGAGAAVVPFIGSMLPSARALSAGAPVEVDISKLEPGRRLVIAWRKKPVWIVHRTKQNLEDLGKLAAEGKLADIDSNSSVQPAYAKNKYRSIKPAYLVVVGICTHLGCSPQYHPEVGNVSFDSAWLGGFFCPCHGSKFDLAGRVYKSVPAPINLVIPPYMYKNNDKVVVIGEDGGVA